MSDHFNDDFFSNSNVSGSENASSRPLEPATEASSEGAYEWNAGQRLGEYRYSYINGQNSTSPHNPNNYDAPSSDRSYSAYTPDPRKTGSTTSGTYNPYSSAPNYGAPQQKAQASPQHSSAPRNHKKPKKEKKPASRGFVAAMLAITVLSSAALGFGGGLFASSMNSRNTEPTTGGTLNVKQVTSSGDSEATHSGSSSVTATTTSDIVKKTADSVVEIATEGVVTGSFNRQYVVSGAGSGVIISEDGYIITNHHVIDDANTITVTLRDGTTTYDATLIGSDESNDIALIKIDAQGLSPATLGDSSALAVGDYVVAIGNPLGTLGGTVTDGIISALAREVTIDNNNMTLLQTNAQISPGNSGGGLFDANGNLIGIVNAKDSATEVEGIAFAIPINNVIGIIKDLQEYGYVTGKIDLGMDFVDISSSDTAFYYGVNQLGCYVLSVNSGSNAEKAGFRRGDLITAVNGTSVTSSADISSALVNNKVGDTVTLTVYRRGSSIDIDIQLEEYKPSAKLNDNARQNDSGWNTDWDTIFNW